MDIAALNLVKTDSFGKVFNEIVPTAPYNSLPRDVVNINQESAELSANKSIAKEDALQAVKLDPAVLEAQVTYKPSHCDKNLSDETLPVAKFKGKYKLESSDCKHFASFKEVVSQTQAALLSLTPQQYDLLLAYVDTLRRQRIAQQMALECAFCKNNGESLPWYTSHALKDWRGRVLCPVLRAFRCPRCGATGDRAHTAKYCPESDNTDK